MLSSEQSGKPLRLLYWRAWWFLGVGIIALVVYLSLADIHMPQVSSTIGDKINHLIAYGVLMGWFGQLYSDWRTRFAWAACLIVLGISMEYLQGATAYRFLDWYDALANTVGVLLGALTLKLGADKILHWFERSVLRVV